MTQHFFTTPSPAAQKLEALRQWFPQAVEVDDKGHIRVNAAAIQMALDPGNPAGVRVEEDGYELRWVGKRDAYHQAFVPTDKIVSAAHSQSQDWDNTGNLLIKGDNLDALKLLRQSYFGKVKLIYIDPPYNTQSDQFIYRDDFTAKQAEVLSSLGYSAENIDYIKNIYGARTHSGWLSFMYPRLLLARDLLEEEGVIAIHMDEHEHANTALLLDSIFGSDNVLGAAAWDKKNPKGDAIGLAYQHESLFFVAKNKVAFYASQSLVRRKKNASQIMNKAARLFATLGQKQLPSDLKKIQKKYKLKLDDLKKFEEAVDLTIINEEFSSWLKKQGFSSGESAYSKIDSEGRVYRLVSMAWPNKKRAPDDYFIPLKHPVTGENCPVPARGWRNPPATMARLLQEDEIEFGVDHLTQPQRKYLLSKNLTEALPSVISFGGSDDAHLADIGIPFDNPKPVEICKEVISTILQGPKGIALDFFAGSGTTAEAVMRLNAEDGGQRQFILVQIPQPIDPAKQKEAYDFVSKTLKRPEATIFEITAERIRRAGAKLQAELTAKRQAQGELLADDTPPLDTGFRVFELVDDPLNLIHRQPLKDASQAQLAELQKRIATPQTADMEKVLSNLLLSEGLPLTTRIQTLAWARKTRSCCACRK